MIQTVNPANGLNLRTYKLLQDDEIDRVLAKATVAQKTWQNLSIEERSQFFRNFAQGLILDKEKLARQMALEMGKPIRQGQAEVIKCSQALSYYADHGIENLQTQNIVAQYHKTRIQLEPFGLILGIMPWNFPIWQLIRAFAPGALTGNAFLFKPAEETLGTAEILEKIANTTFPVPIFNCLPISKEKTLKLIEDDRISGVTFTGSTEVGRKIASVAGQNLKKGVFELGSSDPAIVFEDAHLNEAAKSIVWGRFQNCGQSCIAQKRIFIHSSVYSEMIEKIKLEAQQLKIGDPLDEATDIGPMAGSRFYNLLNDQLNRQLQLKNFEILWQSPVNHLGNSFFPLTIGFCKTWSGPFYTQEVFGPIMPIFIFNSEDEILGALSQQKSGLGASIYSNSEEKFLSFAQQLPFNNIVQNQFVSSDPRVPFSGRRDSGWGIELGIQGLFEFANFKVIGESKKSVFL